MSRPRELGLAEASFLISARKASTSEGGEVATEPLSRAATEDLLWFSIILILPFTPSFPVGQVGPVGPLLLATREMTDKMYRGHENDPAAPPSPLHLRDLQETEISAAGASLSPDQPIPAIVGDP